MNLLNLANDPRTCSATVGAGYPSRIASSIRRGPLVLRGTSYRRTYTGPSVLSTGTVDDTVRLFTRAISRSGDFGVG